MTFTASKFFGPRKQRPAKITNTPVAGKKNVALLFDRDKHVLGIDNLQPKRQ
jgi:hypothetical protein